MGLDQYLTKQVYVGAHWEHREVEVDIQVSVGGMPVAIRPDKLESIREHVITWRKCNAIHGWFDNRVEMGIENCQDYFFDQSVIWELLEDINKVLEDPDLASEILPTTSGFFFGNQEYDSWYFQDLEDTKSSLVESLNNDPPNVQYIYHAWW